jgi:endonuclease/exonuclease/phosphatase family metal-dependent hydrolase
MEFVYAGIFTWLRKSVPDDSTIVFMGDLNLTPESAEYALIEKEGFVSSYKRANMKEPVLTFPTGLTGPHMDRDPPGTFDYIWVKGDRLKVLSSKTFGEKQLAGVEGVFASDHLGITTEFEIIY